MRWSLEAPRVLFSRGYSQTVVLKILLILLTVPVLNSARQEVESASDLGTKFIVLWRGALLITSLYFLDMVLAHCKLYTYILGAQVLTSASSKQLELSMCSTDHGLIGSGHVLSSATVYIIPVLSVAALGLPLGIRDEVLGACAALAGGLMVIDGKEVRVGVQIFLTGFLLFFGRWTGERHRRNTRREHRSCREIAHAVKRIRNCAVSRDIVLHAGFPLRIEAAISRSRGFELELRVIAEKSGYSILDALIGRSMTNQDFMLTLRDVDRPHVLRNLQAIERRGSGELLTVAIRHSCSGRCFMAELLIIPTSRIDRVTLAIRFSSVTESDTAASSPPRQKTSPLGVNVTGRAAVRNRDSSSHGFLVCSTSHSKMYVSLRALAPKPWSLPRTKLVRTFCSFDYSRRGPMTGVPDRIRLDTSEDETDEDFESHLKFAA